jgi:hypothetical protein
VDPDSIQSGCRSRKAGKNEHKKRRWRSFARRFGAFRAWKLLNGDLRRIKGNFFKKGLKVEIFFISSLKNLGSDRSQRAGSGLNDINNNNN